MRLLSCSLSCREKNSFVEKGFITHLKAWCDFSSVKPSVLASKSEFFNLFSFASRKSDLLFVHIIDYITAQFSNEPKM